MGGIRPSFWSTVYPAPSAWQVRSRHFASCSQMYEGAGGYVAVHRLFPRERPSPINRQNRAPTRFAVSASANAKARGRAAGNAISHGDRGARRTSRALAMRAEENDAGLSTGRTGSRHGNAGAGSFFATLKNERHCRQSFSTRSAARQAAIKFIETCCNRRRPHSAIGYQMPAEAMEGFFARTEKCAGHEREAGRAA